MLVVPLGHSHDKVVVLWVDPPAQEQLLLPEVSIKLPLEQRYIILHILRPPSPILSSVGVVPPKAVVGKFTWLNPLYGVF